MNFISRKTYFIIICIMMILSGCNKSAKSYYKDGISNYEKENYEQAKINFEKAIELNSEKAEYYINYGITLIKLGQYGDAVSQLKKSISDKDNKIVRENNKRAYRAIGISYYKNGNYKKAISNFDKALDIDELDYLNEDIMCYKADASMTIGDNEEALKIFTKMIEKNDKSEAAIYYIKRGNIYMLRQEYDLALSDYENAISKNSKNYDYYISKYNALIANNKKQEALNSLNEAITLAVKSSASNLTLGKLYYYSGDITSATNFLNKSIDEKNYDAYYYLGLIAEDNKEIDLALQYYNVYFDNTKEQISDAAYSHFASCLIEQGEYELAFECIENALKLNDSTSSQSLKYNEIAIYERLGDFDTAYEKIIDYVNIYGTNKDINKEIEFLETRINK